MGGATLFQHGGNCCRTHLISKSQFQDFPCKRGKLERNKDVEDVALNV